MHDGRYAHVASAIMPLATARSEGVKIIVAWSAPMIEHGNNHPAILFTMNLYGADYILTMGGVQGVAALGLG